MRLPSFLGGEGSYNGDATDLNLNDSVRGLRSGCPKKEESMKRKQKHCPASLLLVFMLVFTLMPMTAFAETTNVKKITITMPEPVFGQPLPTIASTPDTANTYVTAVEWVDNKTGIAGTSNRVRITVDIKPGADAKFSSKAISATINGVSNGVMVSSGKNRTETRLTVERFFILQDPGEVAKTAAAQEAAVQSFGKTNAASYDTFDYRAYANVYPDLKATYGYDAQKLYAHYVNYGMAEGRVGTFIDAANNPKTGAPLFGVVPGTVSRNVTSTTPAIVPATLLDPEAPTDMSKMVYWTTDQRTALEWMSNAKLVAEYYYVNAYMSTGLNAAGMKFVEAPQMRRRRIYEELHTRASIAETIYCYERGIKTGSGYQIKESDYQRALSDPAYKRTMDTDTTILLHWVNRTYTPFPTPPADPGVAGSQSAAVPAAGYIDGFDPVFYYNAYPDLQAVVTPDNVAALYQHYITTGKAEGRVCHP